MERTAPVMGRLREIVTRHARVAPGVRLTAVPRLHLYRADEPSVPTANVYEPMLCVVVAGRKRVFVGDETVEYGTGDAFLIRVDLPVVGTIIDAQPDRPYLAVAIELHRPTLASIVLECESTPPPVDHDECGMRVFKSTPELLDVACRFVSLLDTPQDVPVLAPLVERELLYRLLTGPWGASARDIVRANSRVSQVSRAVAWLREHYAREYQASVLADVAGISVSSLNRHFRAVTAMSPLAYQKRMRLQEARRLLLTGKEDVSGVGYAVGYRSIPQFTREYRRLFGEPPGRDAERLRRQTLIETV